MKISMETVGKVLVIAGLVQKFGALNVGLCILGITAVLYVILNLSPR